MNNTESAASTENSELIELAAEIASAYVSNNVVPVADLPKLISDVYGTLNGLQTGAENTQPQELKPAVPVKRSVFPDYIVCLEDGKKFKTLKRHLRTHYDMSPEEYRQKWNLPADYPMVASSYSATRSKLAKSIGLGQR